MRDFTISIYSELVIAFKKAGYHFMPYNRFMKGDHNWNKQVILRHDIDSKPESALAMATLERQLEVSGTYYVRNKPGIYNPGIVSAIAGKGHEIGYHYEDLSRNNGNAAKAIQDFSAFVSTLRTMYPVSTICMHGSPLSRYDNRHLWRHYNYRDYGIAAELYLDTDFSNMLYLTDTGRKWNSRFNIRDRVNSPLTCPVRSTKELIHCINKGCMADNIMITVHPQRWTNNGAGWLQELVLQNAKNIAKGILLYKRS